MEEFITRNRTTEQFLYAHGFVMERQFKDEEYMNCWQYRRTPELMQCLRELEQVRRRTEEMLDSLPTIGNPIRTRNNLFQKFCWLHGVKHLAMEKDEDMMTVWIYRNTSEVQRLWEEFRKVQEARMR